MEKKPRPEPDDPEQSERFVDTAKQLDADESGNWFDQAVAVIKLGNAQESHRHDGDKSKTRQS